MIIFILNVIMSSESHPILYNFCHSYANVTESYIFMNVKKNKNILAAGMNRVYFSSQDINQANHQSADNVKQIRPNKHDVDNKMIDSVSRRTNKQTLTQRAGGGGLDPCSKNKN